MASPASAADLEALLERVAKGDREAFADLYRTSSRKLFGIVLRILRRHGPAEEILQEAYVRVWQQADRFDRQRGSAIAWMATIARNRALDEVRRGGSRVVADSSHVADIPDGRPHVLDELELGAELRRLEVCLEGLEERRGEAVRLAYLEGLSRRELADRFALPVGTVKAWLHRSLKQLRDCLES